MINKILLGFSGGRRGYCSGVEAVRKTALYDMHLALGGRMVSFGGFWLPVQHSAGIPESHLHTRQAASLFDVSHMLQTVVRGRDRERWAERLTTADVAGLRPGASVLSLFTDPTTGGILDDLLLSKGEDHLYLVTNASRRPQDTALMLQAQAQIRKEGGEVRLEMLEEHSLLALQGPSSAAILSALTTAHLPSLYFMNWLSTEVAGLGCRVARSGYTGEDGFEISLPSQAAPALAHALLSQPGVAPAGLGARDTLRLEAGLCLYGNDIDTNTTPGAARLLWTIGKRRKEAGDFPGAIMILREKPGERRVGLLCEKGGPPVRSGAVLEDGDGRRVGRVTSGAPSPCLGRNIAMGYLQVDAEPPLFASVRNKKVELTLTKLPFVNTNYYIKKKSK